MAYIRYQGQVTDANKVFPTVFKSVRGKTNGAPFFNYLSMNEKTKIGDIELFVTTTQTPIGNGIKIKEISNFKAVCVTHIGSYETLDKAYEAIYQFASDHKLELTLRFREVFIKGPGMIFKGNPNKYITEIQFPIKELD